MLRFLLPLVAALGLATTARADVSRAEQSRFEETTCWFQVPKDRDMICGRMTVPENRQRAGSRQIRLAVVVFEPDKVRHAPIIYLTGGPGQPIYIETAADIDSWWWFIDREPWLRGRRVVVFDQRGVGLSEPRLDCPNFYDPLGWNGIVSSPDVIPPEGEREAAVAQCRDRLLAEGVDLAAYNTAENAADVAELGRALGLEDYVLFGISYGTRVALEVLRDHPAGVKAAVLDSVLPPEVDFIGESAITLQASLEQLYADCAADVLCSESFGELKPLVVETVRRFNASPLPLRLSEPDEPPNFLTIDGLAYLWILFDSLYDWDRIERLPLLIQRTAQQDYRYLARRAREAYLDVGGDFADAMQMSVGCHEEFPFFRSAPLPKAGPIFDGWVESDFYLWACPLWPAGRAEAIENEPVASEIPVLLLSGDYDPITPPEWARRVAQHLKHGQTLVFRGIGHDVVDSTECGGKAVAEFLANPYRKVKTACVEQLEPPYFIVDEADW